VRWVERRRTAGWSAAIADEVSAASFAVTVRRESGTLLRTTSDRSLVIAAADIAALGSGPIQLELVEVGDMVSRPALLTLDA